MADPNDDMTAKSHYDPQWFAWNGGYLHSNNVLFYFATSPFFDQVSGNQSLYTQWMGTPNQNDILGTRQKFEANLRHQRGTQFVVDHDPLAENVFVDGPNGREQSTIWVIRKQHRENENDDSVTILGYYYIVNQVIYQAPSVASVLSYRMLNSVSALNKVFSAPADLNFFSVSHGHTYHKPIQKSTTQAIAGATQQSKETTPMPGTQLSTGDKSSATTSKVPENDDSRTKTVFDALRMTLQYGKEYMDDMPLVGEPGNFRFNKTKETASSQQKSQLSTSSAATPSQTRAGSTVPATNTSPAGGIKAVGPTDKGTPVPAIAGKKRRKSRAGEPSP